MRQLAEIGEVGGFNLGLGEEGDELEDAIVSADTGEILDHGEEGGVFVETDIEDRIKIVGEELEAGVAFRAVEGVVVIDAVGEGGLAAT